MHTKPTKNKIPVESEKVKKIWDYVCVEVHIGKVHSQIIECWILKVTHTYLCNLDVNIASLREIKSTLIEGTIEKSTYQYFVWNQTCKSNQNIPRQTREENLTLADLAES